MQNDNAPCLKAPYTGSMKKGQRNEIQSTSKSVWDVMEEEIRSMKVQRTNLQQLYCMIQSCRRVQHVRGMFFYIITNTVQKHF